MLRFKSFLGSICISMLFVGLFYTTVFSATLLVIDGQLVGAEDVSVNGTYYDVTFIDGETVDLFSDGSGGVTFDFSTVEEATIAAQALATQAFANGYLWVFETIQGIEYGAYEADLFGAIYPGAVIVTPYGAFDPVMMSLVGVEIYFEPPSVQVEPLQLPIEPLQLPTAFDTADMPFMTYADWTLAPAMSQTPEPATFLLLGIGLLSFAGLTRKKYFNKA